MHEIILAIFILDLLFVPKALAKEVNVKVATRLGQSIIYRFSDFDERRLNFKFKSGKQERQIDPRDINTIYFDTTVSESDTQKISDTLDFFLLNDGNTARGIFKNMDSDEIKALILEDKLKDKKLKVSSVKKVTFSLSILDVDRREFGKGFKLFGKDIELELANEFASQIEKEAQPLDDTLVNSYVDRLGKKIAGLSKRPDLDYRFRVLNSNEINAFTIGGGRVYVYRGLIEQMDNESELAGVLAHEIGHNVGKHTVKQLSKTLLYNGIISATGELIKTQNKEWGEIFKEAGGIVSYFSLMKFSRDDEREADFLGVYNLYQLGYDPNGMVTLFEKFKKIQGHEPSKLEVFFQTHPKPSERMENTLGEINKLKIEYLKKDDQEFQKIKEYLQELPQPVMQKILVNDTLLVRANGYGWYTLEINTEVMKNCVLKGQFVAGGGSGNDIKTFIFDEINFINWKNGHNASSIYNSGKVTAGQIDLPINKSGNYYLVFDNTFSLLTDKTLIMVVWTEFTEK